ncbi:MAG: type II toxin-antitoxin system VapC family toxin [Actinomycetota bacterium]|nr:type II toxin-antitoxin system VapC family toxin [Actinomycetota bacterium]
MEGLKYLLDTNVLSEPLLPVPNSLILERLRDHQHEVATASVVWHELRFGLHRLPLSARRSTIQEYLNEVVKPSVRILPYETRAAEWHASERARLVGAGRTQPFVDGQIAAVAWAYDLTLVTANLTDYVGFRGVQVVDWSA